MPTVHRFLPLIRKAKAVPALMFPTSNVLMLLLRIPLVFLKVVLIVSTATGVLPMTLQSLTPLWQKQKHLAFLPPSSLQVVVLLLLLLLTLLLPLVLLLLAHLVLSVLLQLLVKFTGIDRMKNISINNRVSKCPAAPTQIHYFPSSTRCSRAVPANCYRGGSWKGL